MFYIAISIAVVCLWLGGMIWAFWYFWDLWASIFDLDDDDRNDPRADQ